jgi:hypothetical protein
MWKSEYRTKGIKKRITDTEREMSNVEGNTSASPSLKPNVLPRSLAPS